MSCTVVELTNHYTVRAGRIYRDAVCDHGGVHYLPTEAAA